MNKQKIIASAVGRTENLSSDWGFKSFTMAQNDLSIRRHKIEWHRKITISLSCLLFFFIGAPLGGIIRKGDWVCRLLFPCLPYHLLYY